MNPMYSEQNSVQPMASLRRMYGDEQKKRFTKRTIPATMK
jgi:hypothetical protein